MEICDDVYTSLKRHFLMEGKGRRPALPVIALTNKILLQLLSLKDEASASWDLVLSWFVKLFPDQSVTASQLQYRMQRTQCTMESLCEEESVAFLQQSVNFNIIPEELEQIGLTHDILLGDAASFAVMHGFTPTVSILLSLEAVRVKYKFQESFLTTWVQALMRHHPVTMSASQIKHRLCQVKKDRLKLKHKPLQMEELLQRSLVPLVNLNSNENSVSVSHDKCCKLEISLKAVKEDLKRERKALLLVNERVNNLNIEIDALRSEKVFVDNKNAVLLSENATLRNDLTYLRDNIQLTKPITVKHKSIQTIKNFPTEQHVYDKKIIESNESKIDMMEEEIVKLKKEKRSEQQQKSNYKKQLEQTLMTAESILSQDDPHCVNKFKINLRGELGNTYSDNVHMTYMTLQGEADVAASKCSKVINIISKYLYDSEIPMRELPSTQTALNIASEGYFLSSTQAVESIINTDHFTLGTDETSRQKRRYLENHIVLSNGGTLSLGFDEIASETADTLLERSISMFQELCEIYCAHDEHIMRDSLFKEILGKMKCLMSDRASVMKLFDKKMANYKIEILGTDCSTHFLFCNAHFLLGLATAAESALKEMESTFIDSGEKLGRDQYPSKYFKFQQCNEASCLRLIRLAADVFGPRPDEKNGCRQEWLVFLESINVVSRFSSYRSNRFNNVFHNASALLFHKDHIVSFLQDKVSHDNLKLQSVLDDIRDDNILGMVSALATFNFLFSSPYWGLLNSNTSYGEFPPFVLKMQSFLEKSCPSQDPVFQEFASEHLNLDGDFVKSQVFLDTFNLICSKSNDVVKRQLADFIGDGIFAGDLDEEVMAVLLTAPLSNLTGERLFGDLDYDIGKRRRASLHLRSALNMFKHNKTGQWLSRKVSSDAKHLLSVARKNRKQVRCRSRERERDVRRKVMERLTENENRRKAKEIRDRERHLEIVNAVVVQGGLCACKDDVDKLLEEGSRVESLKAQIRYRKVVLKQENLILTGNYSQLYDSLISFLEDNVEGPVGRQFKSKRGK